MASPYRLPPIETVPSLPTEQRAKLLDLLFEPSTQLHTLSVETLQQETFSSYNDLIAAIGIQLTQLSESASASDKVWLEDILVSHPRLGEKNIQSVQSQAEQAHLQGSVEEADRLRLLNDEYERHFPGLRYVVFAGGRSSDVLMDDIRRRIAQSDLNAERAAVIRVRLVYALICMILLTQGRQCARLRLIGQRSWHELARDCIQALGHQPGLWSISQIMRTLITCLDVASKHIVLDFLLPRSYIFVQRSRLDPFDDHYDSLGALHRYRQVCWLYWSIAKEQISRRPHDNRQRKLRIIRDSNYQELRFLGAFKRPERDALGVCIPNRTQ